MLLSYELVKKNLNLENDCELAPLSIKYYISSYLSHIFKTGWGIVENPRKYFQGQNKKDTRATYQL